MNANTRLLTQVGCLVGSLAAACACAGVQDTPDQSASTEATRQNTGIEDLWIDTRLETAYLFNSHLNNFKIQTDVDKGAVLLTGTVASDIDKELAEEIAKSLNGVRSVDNRLVVRESASPSERDDEAASFASKVDDATTAARVKTRLIANDHLAGLKINVDTDDSVVTLAGSVDSDQERQLAELIAKNTPDVRSVSNQLKVSDTGSS